MVPCPLCLAAAFSWAVRLARDAWCFAAQVSHLVRSGTAGFGQSLHSPRDLASSRLAWAALGCSSLRSGVWALFWSFSRPLFTLASTSAGVGARLGLGCFASRGLGGIFCDLGFLARWVLGLLFLVFWADRSMVYSKSCPLAWCIPVGLRRGWDGKGSRGRTGLEEPAVAGA